MSRRVSLPTADDLFRPTTHEQAAQQSAQQSAEQPVTAVRVVRPVSAVDIEEAESARSRRTSGRVRHDEKMTVYVTAEELHHLEQTRLTLRSVHGLAADRGRLVREALNIVLADFEANGVDSVLVQRLTEG